MNSSSASSSPAKKKARVEVAGTTTLETTLPLVLELVLPFLSATVHLPKIALLNKAGFKAARLLYEQRRNTPMPIKNDGCSSSVPKVTSVISDTSDECYVTPWWLMKDQAQTIRHGYPIKVLEDGSWILAVEETEWGDLLPDLNIISPQTQQKLSFPEPYLELFDNDIDGADLVHFSQVNQRLLVLLTRWIDRGTTPTNLTRKQLFAVLYDLSKPPTKHPSSSLLLPTICQKITEPVGPGRYGFLLSTHLGNCHRSRNGKVLAVVTAVIQSSFFRPTAEVTVFDVTETALVQRCVLEMPIGQFQSSWLTMTISNCGELLSINSLRSESNGDCGSWRVYDIREKGQAKIIAQNERVEKFLLSHQFTPDNELLMILPERYRHDPQRNVTT